MRNLAGVIGLAFVIGISSRTARPQTAPAPGIVVLPVTGSTIPLDPSMPRAYSIQRGMPYSGVRIGTAVTIFPGGQRQEYGSSTKEWRDSEGRTREDITWTRVTGEVVTACQIEDPVALVRYIWRVGTTEKTVVTETHYKMEGSVAEVWPNPPDHKYEPVPGRTIVILTQQRDPDVNPNDETLAPKYLNGVYVTGVRSVVVIPPGRQGNETDHSVNRINEIWTAPDLNMTVSIFFDTGLGFRSLSELKDIDRSEPDPSMFRPPSGLPKRVAPESDPVWRTYREWGVSCVCGP